MSTDLRRKAIEQTVLKRNLFATCPRLEIRNKRFGRSLSQRMMESSMIQIGLRLLELGTEKILKVAAIIIGLILGWGLALLLSSIFLGIAWYVLKPNLSQGIMALLFKLSWWNSLGWVLTGISIFVFPYFLLGCPTYASLRLYRLIHLFFARRRRLRELQGANDNNDPILLKAQIATYGYVGERSRFSQFIERILSGLGTLLGILTGGIAGITPLLIYLKLAAWLLNISVWALVFAVVMTGGWGLILGLVALAWFFRSFLAGGMALSYFIKQLFAGEPYLGAMGEASATFIDQTLQIEE